MAVTRIDNMMMMTTSGDSIEGQFAITKIKWTGTDIAASDELVIKNGNGDVVYKHVVSTYSLCLIDTFPHPLYVDGIELDSITGNHGDVLIYYK